MSTKWGIAGAGKISNDFVLALSLRPDDHQVISVGASDRQRAVDFKNKFNIPNAYGSYEELAKDPDVEVVYIGVINTNHLHVSKLMLENGKHVLCEKPLCMNTREVTELVELAKKKELFLMEAIWSRFFPVYKEVRRILENKELGDVYHVSVNFGILIHGKDRVKLKELGGGTTLDIGIYTLQVATMVLGTEPQEVKAVGHLNEYGVDESAVIALKYSNGKTASLIINSRVKFDNCAVVYGTKGYLKIADPFWSPTILQTPSGEINYPLPDTEKKFLHTNGAGMIYEADEVRSCLKKGWTESPVISHKESIALAKLEDKIRQQIGVVYAVDK